MKRARAGWSSVAQRHKQPAPACLDLGAPLLIRLGIRVGGGKDGQHGWHLQQASPRGRLRGEQGTSPERCRRYLSHQLRRHQCTMLPAQRPLALGTLNCLRSASSELCTMPKSIL